MELIKITDGTQEPYSMGQLRRDNKTVSFPKMVDPATLESYGVFSAVEADIPTYNRISQSITRAETAVEVADQWTYNWIVVDKSTEELAAINRAERDRRLANTDYMALSDVTMSEAVTTYRQALRDITSHANWPNLANAEMDGTGGDWPAKPE
tara:strand:+ start:378 stop:836 length:459 start_codon:yes stop_codon:yes gene_type:complete